VTSNHYSAGFYLYVNKFIICDSEVFERAKLNFFFLIDDYEAEAEAKPKDWS